MTERHKRNEAMHLLSVTLTVHKDLLEDVKDQEVKRQED